MIALFVVGCGDDSTREAENAAADRLHRISVALFDDSRTRDEVRDVVADTLEERGYPDCDPDPEGTIPARKVSWAVAADSEELEPAIASRVAFCPDADADELASEIVRAVPTLALADVVETIEKIQQLADAEP